MNAFCFGVYIDTKLVHWFHLGKDDLMAYMLFMNCTVLILFE
jgi:hypothetical protein